MNAFIVARDQAPKGPERLYFDTPSYDRMAYGEKSPDELAGLAESSLADYKQSAERAIETSSEAQQRALEENRKNAVSAAERKAASLTDAYETAKKTVSDDVLKRGLARSSIAVNKQAALSDSAAHSAAAISAELSDTVAKLDNEIAGLSQKREQALSDFNIAYAAKMTEKMMELTAEQEKKKAEAVKYNNSLAEKEYEAGVAAREKEASIYGRELDNYEKSKGIAGGASDKSEAVYRKMCELLDGLNGADARAAVMEKAIFRDSLNDYYYYKLYDRYTR